MYHKTNSCDNVLLVDDGIVATCAKCGVPSFYERFDCCCRTQNEIIGQAAGERTRSFVSRRSQGRRIPGKR